MHARQVLAFFFFFFLEGAVKSRLRLALSYSMLYRTAAFRGRIKPYQKRQPCDLIKHARQMNDVSII
jgi:hypothetical protein